MKIKEVELKYFKFHQELTVNFNTKSLLIYGENGTGKSSIYEALYSNFYHQKRLDKSIDIQQTYKNRNFPVEDLEVKIQFDNSQVLNRSGDTLSSFDILKVGLFEPTIYFANERVLNRLTKENFYIALRDTLVEHFPNMKSLKDMFQDKFDEIRRWQNETKFKQKQTPISNEDIETQKNHFISELNNLNKEFKEAFDQQIPLDEINKIIRENLDEDFIISFEDFKGAEIPTTSQNLGLDFEINLPIIKIKIDNIECNGKLSHHFNEAKLKLIGVAIYFALAKKYEDSGDGFKLLVLDDFLTSLDMANRKLIMKYILEEFKDYQKLILTHNLQFFNMTRKMIDLDREDEKQWKIQKLFIHNNQAFLYDKDISYLKEADDSLSRGDESSAGNFIRKEFERVVTEFEQLFELGVVEESKNIIYTLESQDKFCNKPSEQLNDLLAAVQSALDCQDSEQKKFGYIKSALNKAQIKQISFNEKTQNPNGSFSETTIQSEIKKAKFYKNFILNPASHHDYEANIFTKECKNAIKILKYLNTIINNLKGTKYE